MTLADIPDYFDGNIATSGCDHIKGVTTESTDYYHDAHVILLWQSVTGDELKAIKSKFKNKRVYTVATHCVEAREFGNYGRVLWDNLDYKCKQNILNKSEEIFRQYHNEKIQTAPINEAVVIGTGPSVDKVFKYDLKNRFVIGCNSVVKSEDLLAHCQFDVVCAGDAVSHFSPCGYAGVFRRDLRVFLEKFDGIFFTTALVGYLLWVRWPELRHKIILCEQNLDKPNTNLLSHWGLPKLDSVLNIHMLPIASTVAKRLTLIGFDGRSPKKDENEDFWGHSSMAQYHEFVHTGHAMHPTFDILRQRNTENRFIESTAYSLDVLAKTGKELVSIEPSHTPAINQLYVSKDS